MQLGYLKILYIVENVKNVENTKKKNLEASSNSLTFVTFKQINEMFNSYLEKLLLVCKGFHVVGPLSFRRER